MEYFLLKILKFFMHDFACMYTCFFTKYLKQSYIMTVKNWNKRFEKIQVYKYQNAPSVHCVFLKYLIQRCNKVKNSERVLEFSLNSPNIQDVTVLLVVFCTPLMTMHIWAASITTPTPAGPTAFWTAFAISLVNLS